MPINPQAGGGNHAPDVMEPDGDLALILAATVVG